MLDVVIRLDSIRFGDHLTVSFKRTLRLADDGTVHRLPPNFGVFPVYQVADFAGRVPAGWRAGEAFIPVYQREALYVGFDHEAPWRPHAVKVAAGRINALTGEFEVDGLTSDPQNYLVCPPQLWLDGFKTGTGVVRQFVAVSFGTGHTIEAALAGAEGFGGLQITIHAPQPGRFPDERPAAGEDAAAPRPFASRWGRQVSKMVAQQMGLGAGGELRQNVFPDPHGADAWDQSNFGRVCIHLVNSARFQEITGQEPPPTPVTEHTYAEHKFRWFPAYGVEPGAVAATARLANAQTIAQRDAELNPTEGRTTGAPDDPAAASE